MADLKENLVPGIVVLVELGFAVCFLALLGSRNRRKSVFQLVTTSWALFDRRNFTSHGHRWQRRIRWILVIAAVTLLLTTHLLHEW